MTGISTEAFSPRKSLRIVFGWLSPKRKVQLAILLGLSLLGALAKLATLGEVLLLIGLMADPDAAHRLSTLEGYRFVDRTSQRSVTEYVSPSEKALV